MKDPITYKSQEQMASDGWRIIAKLPANSSAADLDKIRKDMAHTNVAFTYNFAGENEDILVWTQSDELIGCKIMQHSPFKAFTTFIAHSLATAFFFWADWRIGTGWVLLVLGSLNFTAAKHAFEEGRKSVRNGGGK